MWVGCVEWVVRSVLIIESTIMPMARRHIVDPAVTPWYHCISRCVRRAFLCGAQYGHRKEWIESRLEVLSKIFTIHVGGFAILDNHLHVLLKLDCEQSQTLTAEEVARRWGTLCPPRDDFHKPMPITDIWIANRVKDVEWIETMRKRLCELGWFMKFLKEPIARRANREDNCTGAFFEGRFRSIAILDEVSLLATMAYIDLNPVAAGLAATPETSPHTSIKSRIDQCAANGTLEVVQQGNRYSLPENVEQGSWMLPIEQKHGSDTRGMLPGLSLTGYLEVLDWSSRALRPGKAHVAEEAPPILDRLKIGECAWLATLQRLFGPVKTSGSHFGTTSSLTDAASAKGRKFLKNVTGRDLAAASDTSG